MIFKSSRHLENISRTAGLEIKSPSSLRSGGRLELPCPKFYELKSGPRCKIKTKGFPGAG